MILVDPPRVPAHGRLWSHLASDTSYAELHAFADRLGVPRRGFDRDHYDVPDEWYERAVALGAVPVSSRELARRLATSGLRRRKAEALRPRPAGAALVRPARLREGDLVAVVAPAGRVADADLAAGVAVVEGWGLRVRPVEPPGAGVPHLAGPDADRAAALTAAWTDPEVRVLMTTRGGYGTQRLLDGLDWPRLAAAGPRLLVGFSDVTALLEAARTRLGLATVHGPNLAGLGTASEPTRTALRRLLLDGVAGPLTGLEPLVPGVARGPLAGGNLAVLAASVGTPTAGPAAGSVVVLEDVGEAHYRLDRLLTQLLRSGWFEGVRGVVLGDLTRCGDPEAAAAVVAERLRPLGVPMVRGAPVGHGEHNLALPLGLPAVLDASAGTLTVGRSLR